MEPSSDNTNRPVKTTSDNTSRTVMASADSTSGSVKASSDAEDIVTGGKNNEAANEMKCDWAKILTSEKYSGVFAGRTADELRVKYSLKLNSLIFVLYINCLQIAYRINTKTWKRINMNRC
ncbi:hypothetical protein MTR_4g133515 [Medicago truncatula]|uniref:Uncharacterized protein n=1 Tax=Medicago truncatula TaxID=3880 RepID=A0A072UTJ2_MEDTR|nr:hypothetical protein MTR_4g133515 [Medicago truncatula]